MSLLWPFFSLVKYYLPRSKTESKSSIPIATTHAQFEDFGPLCHATYPEEHLPRPYPIIIIIIISTIGSTDDYLSRIVTYFSTNMSPFREDPSLQDECVDPTSLLCTLSYLYPRVTSDARHLPPRGKDLYASWIMGLAYCN